MLFGYKLYKEDFALQTVRLDSLLGNISGLFLSDQRSRRGQTDFISCTSFSYLDLYSMLMKDIDNIISVNNEQR